MAAIPIQEAYVSLATNNEYCHGAIALAGSLRQSNTTKKLCLMITNKVSMDMRGNLEKLWDEVIVIEEYSSGDKEKLALLKRPELGVTFSKIHAWRLVHYTKCVFLDADTLVLTNVDELFERDEISASPDIGWPDLFNSGVFVFQPSLDTFANLLDLAQKEGSYDGGDQGLLNIYWNDWSLRDSAYRLPFVYNVVANLTYSYPPAVKHFYDKIKIIHFLGSIKPWHHRYIPSDDKLIMFPSYDTSHYCAEEFIKKWWTTYHSTTTTATVSTIPHSSVATSTVSTEETVMNTQGYQGPISLIGLEGERRSSWERGQPDYLGVDQSDNVIEHIRSNIN